MPSSSFVYTGYMIASLTAALTPLLPMTCLMPISRLYPPFKKIPLLPRSLTNPTFAPNPTPRHELNRAHSTLGPKITMVNRVNLTLTQLPTPCVDLAGSVPVINQETGHGSRLLIWMMNLRIFSSSHPTPRIYFVSCYNTSVPRLLPTKMFAFIFRVSTQFCYFQIPMYTTNNTFRTDHNVSCTASSSVVTIT